MDMTTINPHSNLIVRAHAHDTLVIIQLKSCYGLFL